MKLALTFPARFLPFLVPKGGTPDSTWVVCQADSLTDAWHPFLPLSTREAAASQGERMARTLSAKGIYHLNWWHADSDGGPGLELYALLDDGTKHRCGLAIVPLALLADADSR